MCTGAFGSPSAARGVDDHRVVGRGHARFDVDQEVGVEARPVPSSSSSVVAHALFARTPHGDGAQIWSLAQRDPAGFALIGQPGQRLFETLDKIVVAERRGGQDRSQIGVTGGPGQLRSLVEGVERYRDRADACGGEPGDRPIDAVRHENPDVITLADTLSKQGHRQPRRRAVEIDVAQFASVGDDERLVPEPRCTRPHQGGDRGNDRRERHERRIVALPKIENIGSREELARRTMPIWRDPIDAALAARLDRIESRQAISQLPSRYAMALDARDLDSLVALFVDDVEAGADGRGRDALKRWYDVSAAAVLPKYPPDIRAPIRSRRPRSRDRFGLLSCRTRGW